MNDPSPQAPRYAQVTELRRLTQLEQGPYGVPRRHLQSQSRCLSEPPPKALRPAQILELRRLYDMLADSSAAASEALGKAGGMPTGLRAESFRALDARVRKTLERIRMILGR